MHNTTRVPTVKKGDIVQIRFGDEVYVPDINSVVTVNGEWRNLSNTYMVQDVLRMSPTAKHTEYFRVMIKSLHDVVLIFNQADDPCEIEAVINDPEIVGHSAHQKLLIWPSDDVKNILPTVKVGDVVRLRNYDRVYLPSEANVRTIHGSHKYLAGDYNVVEVREVRDTQWPGNLYPTYFRVTLQGGGRIVFFNQSEVPDAFNAIINDPEII